MAKPGPETQKLLDIFESVDPATMDADKMMSFFSAMGGAIAESGIDPFESDIMEFFDYLLHFAVTKRARETVEGLISIQILLRTEFPGLDKRGTVH